MNKMPYSFICAINKFVCDKSSEPYAVINKNNIMSALSVFDSYYQTEEEVAAALYRSLIIGHGFMNGNKRTAFLTLYFLCPPSCDETIAENLAIRISQNSRMSISEIVAVLYDDI